MWWNEASKGLDTEQLMCACVRAPTEHGNSAVVMIPCGQRGFFSNTPCEVCGQIPVVTRGYISSTSCYHYTHGDISACMYTCMYNLLPRMQLIWPELVSARLSWVAGVLAHSHGFLTHDTILHSQWVAFQTRCVGSASELVVKSDSDSLRSLGLLCLGCTRRWAIVESNVCTVRGSHGMRSLFDCCGELQLCTQCSNALADVRQTIDPSTMYIYLRMYVRTCIICTIVAQYADCIYRPWYNVHLALNKTASGCWSLIGLLLKWQHVRTHNTLSRVSYRLLRSGVCVYVCVQHS